MLRRWPGGLIEFFGMTEGGGSCMLLAHDRPDKLHTVGQPMAGHDIRVIDAAGEELPAGEVGELVGRSPAMMRGYLNASQASAATEWRDAQGERFIRTGDLGRFDAEGFLILMGRTKDLIISGGHNIYPIDLETVLDTHEAVEESAVFGVPSERWGETPVAAVTLRNADTSVPSLLAWANECVGKSQRLHDIVVVDALPRNALGKVDKRMLRERYAHRVRDSADECSTTGSGVHTASR